MVCLSIWISSVPAKMSQPSEKGTKNEIIVAERGGESPVSPQVGTNGQPYTEAKKTWKSFFWSSEHPITARHRRTVC